MKFAFSLIALILAFPSADRDPNAVLETARAKVQAMTRRLTNYACIETVNREYFQQPPSPPVADASTNSCKQVLASTNKGGLKLEYSDRLRLEVTVAENHEILSQPGATRFDERGVDQIIPVGTMGTGSFGTYLIGIFSQPGVTFQYQGEKSLDQKTSLEYRYQVPLEASRYRVKAGVGWRAVTYDGSFLLDPQSLDIQQLTIHTDESPAETSVCQAVTTLDYQPARAGDILLPRESRLQVVMRNGRETSNATTFSGCREYQAESAMRFDDAPVEEEVAKPVQRASINMPLGLSVTLALADAIDTDTAAAGDIVSAKVVTGVVRPGTTAALLPAGAIVRGRITRMEHHLLPKPYFLITMSFNRVEIEGMSAPFGARLEPDVNIVRDLGVDLVSHGRAASWNAGTLLVPTKQPRYLLPAGYQMKWFTLATIAR